MQQVVHASRSLLLPIGCCLAEVCYVHTCCRATAAHAAAVLTQHFLDTRCAVLICCCKTQVVVRAQIETPPCLASKFECPASRGRLLNICCKVAAAGMQRCCPSLACVAAQATLLRLTRDWCALQDINPGVWRTGNWPVPAVLHVATCSGIKYSKFGGTWTKCCSCTQQTIW